MQARATGFLRFGPQSPSLPRKGWWILVEGDRDWFHLYGRWAQQSQTPEWIRAVDRDRVFESRFVDMKPRLAIKRPKLLAPAWGPHISVCRNERPRRHRDLWMEAVQIGDLLSRRSWLRSQGRPTHKVDRELRDRQQAWIDKARARGVPESMAPGAKVEFTFDVNARTNGHHWWFPVTCPILGDIRVTFGLPRRPRVPFHLTFAVLEGSDPSQGVTRGSK